MCLNMSLQTNYCISGHVHYKNLEVTKSKLVHMIDILSNIMIKIFIQGKFNKSIWTII